MPVASKTRALYFSPSGAVPTLVTPRLSSATVSGLAEAAVAAGDDGAVDDGRALGPALQRGRVGQAEVLDEQLARRGWR